MVRRRLVCSCHKRVSDDRRGFLAGSSQSKYFSLGVVFSTTNMKELLRPAPTVSSRIACDTVAVKPIRDTPHPKSSAPPTLDLEPPISNNCSRTILSERRLRRAVYILLLLWGVVVLALHAQASVRPALPQCLLQVYPWGVSAQACYLVDLNCEQLGIYGKQHQLEEKWGEFDRSNAIILVIRHCPSLEMPDSLQDFSHARIVKIFDSTIDSWSASAALTNTNHPSMMWLYLTRVNMTGGVLYAGLQSSDFPHKLLDIELYFTNLRSLPDDLDSKWIVGTFIYIEYSQLTSALVRLEPTHLILTGNPIAELPPEVFEINGIQVLGVGGTELLELPRNVTKFSPTLRSIYMTDTDISFLWQWIDPFVTKSLALEGWSLFMAGSMYCKELDRISSGETDAFSSMQLSGYSELLMDPYRQNRDVILHTVSCTPGYTADTYQIDVAYSG